MFLPDSAMYRKQKVVSQNEPSFWESVAGALPAAGLATAGAIGGGLLAGPLGAVEGGTLAAGLVGGGAALGGGLGAPMSQKATTAIAGTTTGEEPTGELMPLPAAVKAREQTRQRWTSLRGRGQG